MNTINVGIGEYAVAGRDSVLSTVLGSCVGVILYDKLNRIGGLAHVYLPDSGAAGLRHSRERENLLTPALKYADLLIPRLVEDMTSLGADKRHFLGYVIGGARLHDFPEDSSLNVGRLNLEKVRLVLQEQHLRYLEVKVGGKTGRKVVFDIASGDIEVREFGETA